MMKQAQEVQTTLQEIQEKLKDLTVESVSGGGLIKLTITCSGDAQSIEIDQSLMEAEKEMLEDLIVAAINTANEAKEERIKQETESALKGLGLPEDLANIGESDMPL